MTPLESSARAITVTALASALWVTVYTSTGSVVGIADSRMSMAACICPPCRLAVSHRHTSARVRISGRTLSASVLIGASLGTAENCQHQTENGQRPDHRARGDRPPASAPAALVDHHGDAGEDQRRVERQSESHDGGSGGAGQCVFEGHVMSIAGSGPG